MADEPKNASSRRASDAGLEALLQEIEADARVAPARLPTLCAQLGNARSGGVKSLLPLDDGSLITGGVDGGCSRSR